MIAFILTLIINVISIFFLILFCISIFTRFSEKKIDLYKYKIKSKGVSIIILVSYISIFIILFYIIRLYNFGKEFDLKLFLNILSIFWSIFITTFTLIQKITIFVYIIILLLFAVFVITISLKKINTEIFKNYLYYIYMKRKRKPLYFFCFERKCNQIGNNDIITYLLGEILYKTCFFINKKHPLSWKNFYTMQPWYHYSKIMKSLNNLTFYNFIQKSSPIFFIIYDCFFNNFVLVHFYYYMLFFIPLMLFKRITNAISKTNSGFASILWDIYYNHNNYYVVTLEQESIISILLQADLGYVHELGVIGFEWHLKQEITYTLKDYNNNIYWNLNGVELKIKNKKIFIVTEDELGNNIFTETKDYILL